MGETPCDAEPVIPDLAYTFTCCSCGYDAPVVAQGKPTRWEHVEVRQCGHCSRRYVVRTTVVDATVDHERHWRDLRRADIAAEQERAEARTRELLAPRLAEMAS